MAPQARDDWRQQLAELGWIEGQNLIVEYRCAEGSQERLRDMAADLVHAGVEVIATWSTPEAVAAQQATSTIPIVAGGADPVRAGAGREPRAAGWEHHRDRELRHRVEREAAGALQGVPARPRASGGPAECCDSGESDVRGAHGGDRALGTSPGHGDHLRRHDRVRSAQGDDVAPGGSAPRRPLRRAQALFSPITPQIAELAIRRPSPIHGQQ